MAAGIDEWSEREKIMVYGGIAIVIAMSAVTFVFVQFVIVEDRFRLSDLWKSGMSGFAIALRVLPFLYLVTAIPAAAVGSVAYSHLKRNAFRIQNTLLLLALSGEGFVLIAVLLALFDLALSKSSLILQILLIAITCSVSIVSVARTTRIRTVREISRRILTDPTVTALQLFD